MRRTGSPAAILLVLAGFADAGTARADAEPRPTAVPPAVRALVQSCDEATGRAAERLVSDALSAGGQPHAVVLGELGLGLAGELSLDGDPSPNEREYLAENGAQAAEVFSASVGSFLARCELRVIAFLDRDRGLARVQTFLFLHMS